MFREEKNLAMIFVDLDKAYNMSGIVESFKTSGF